MGGERTYPGNVLEIVGKPLGVAAFVLVVNLFVEKLGGFFVDALCREVGGWVDG